jgi:4,5-DOPA dioxygenase extradiol
MLSLPLFAQADTQSKTSNKMPALFISHGSPMNILADNTFTQSLKALGKTLPKPKAILVISAHWYTKGTYLSDAKNPETMYDFFGFPEPLYDFTYPALGAPKIAQNLHQNSELFKLKNRGLDHGAYSVLTHLFPDADVPVFQMSIDRTKKEAYHYKLGRYLQELRHQGVMIIGSGGVTHNLNDFKRDTNAPIAPWAQQFDSYIKKALVDFEHQDLINYKNNLDDLAIHAHPSDEHYLPLLYIAGLQEPNDSLNFIHEGFMHSTFSMRSFMI